MPTTEKLPGWTVEALGYPLTAVAREELIGLLRTEWTHTDYDWLEAMNGDYSEKLVITSVLARYDGELLATATIHFSRHHPEVAVIGNVLTHRNHRDRGLAGRVLEVALEQANTAGCMVCLLGTARNPHNVYRHHGFAWQNGSVMRRAFRAEDFEQGYFAAGQPAAVRAAHWGDLPGVTLFGTQPIASVCLDHARKLYSGRYTPTERCLSIFPLLWYATAARGGQLAVLAGPESGRVFGFGSLTPGASATQPATIEFVTHDHYEAHRPALLAHLLDHSRAQKVASVEAHVVSDDGPKLAALREAGFVAKGRLPQALQVNGAAVEVVRLGRSL